MNSPTFQLLEVEPSFLRGVSSLFDYSGVLSKYNMSETDDMADSNAIRSDWEAVGCDLVKAISEYEQEKG